MNQDDRFAREVSPALNNLFSGGIKTAGDRLLFNITKITGVIAFTGGAFLKVIEGLPLGWQNVLAGVTTISAITFIASLCLLGMHIIGRAAGKKNLFTQMLYVLAKVTLYILLPCAIITLLIVLWAIITKQPAFR